MKKFLLVAVAFGFGLVSCRKDYSCVCALSGSQSGTETTTITDSKNNAKEKCDEGDFTGNGLIRQCEIKD